MKTYATRWYGEATSFGAASTVTVESGVEDTEVNARLVAGATAKGRVTSGLTGNPIEEVVFGIEEPEPGVYEYLGFSVGNSAGEYTIPGIGEHKAYIDFTSYGCPVGEPGCPHFYALQLFDGASTLATATPLLLRAGEAVTEINAVMQEGGHIAGRITTASVEDEPIADAYVCATVAAASQGIFAAPGGCAYSNGNGEYTIDGLSTQSYDVQFTGEVCPGEQQAQCHDTYQRQYYSGETTELQANALSVIAQTTVGGIDARLLEVSPRTPVSTSAPVLSGIPAVGDVLGCSQGVWEHGPTGLSYVWLLNGTPISGQTSASYAVQPSAQGGLISCEVTASNAAGSASAGSGTLRVPVALPPTPGVGELVSTSAVTHRRTTVVVRCVGATACTGTAELVATVPRKHHGRGRHGRAVEVVIGHAGFAVAPGTTETFAIDLAAKGAKLVRAAGRAGLRVLVRGPGLTTSTARLTDRR